MKTTVLVFLAIILVLCAAILLERLREASPLALAAGTIAMLASTLALWTILPAEARHNIERRAGAAGIAIKGKVAEIADVLSADAPRRSPPARTACRRNEFYSRISKACVPEWNIKAR
jgi:hypothetical protein